MSRGHGKKIKNKMNDNGNNNQQGSTPSGGNNLVNVPAGGNNVKNDKQLNELKDVS